jgi:hypothetical protein
MVTLIVKYSVEKDTETYVDFVYQYKAFRHGNEDRQKNLLKSLDNELQEIIKTADNEDNAYKAIKECLQKRYDSDTTLMNNHIKMLVERWNNIGANIIYFLEFLYHKPFPFDEITVYLTTNNICPYSYEKRYFFTNYKFVTEQIDTAKHELNHFMFYYYYNNLKEKMSEEKYDLLKESLALFSNPNQLGKPNETPIRKLYKSKLWLDLDDAIAAGYEYLTKESN